MLGIKARISIGILSSTQSFVSFTIRSPFLTAFSQLSLSVGLLGLRLPTGGESWNTGLKFRLINGPTSLLSSAPGAVIPSFSAQLTFTVDRFFEAFVFDCFLGVVLGLDFGVVLGLDFGFVLGLAFGRDLGGIWSKGNKKSGMADVALFWGTGKCYMRSSCTTADTKNTTVSTDGRM